MELKYFKMNGLGNDFVIIDGRNKSFELSNNNAANISNRKYGIGCDQLIIIRDSESCDVAMDIYNSDGSISGACGNASRCVADIIMREKKLSNVNIETQGGVLKCKRHLKDQVYIDMGKYNLKSCDIPLKGDFDTSQIDISKYVKDIKDIGVGFAVNVGNPHIVFFVPDCNDINIGKIGPIIENLSIFPEKTNVEFATVNNKNEIRMRVWERGSGETKACGTGACAVGIAGYLTDRSNADSIIHLDGGSLGIKVVNDNVHMYGEVTYEYEGSIAIV